MDKTTKDFWDDINFIIRDGFKPEGLEKLEKYVEQFNNRKLLFKRFSPQEQHGCSEGGFAHEVATLLAGAEVAASENVEGSFKDFKRELQLAKKQIKAIKEWSLKSGVWFNDIENQLSKNLGDYFAQGGEADVYDNGTTVIKSIGLDYFIQPIYALDRITLHNTYFPETTLKVIGFGEDSHNNFKIIVEQSYIQGLPVSQNEIEEYLLNLGFQLHDLRNWTYYTPEIYLSDMHDENIIKSSSGTFFILDCDIRINSPHLKTNGIRKLNLDIEFL